MAETGTNLLEMVDCQPILPLNGNILPTSSETALQRSEAAIRQRSETVASTVILMIGRSIRHTCVAYLALAGMFGPLSRVLFERVKVRNEGSRIEALTSTECTFEQQPPPTRYALYSQCVLFYRSISVSASAARGIHPKHHRCCRVRRPLPHRSIVVCCL